MVTDNIIQMPTPLSVLAEQLRTDVRLIDQGRDQWVEGMLQLAQHLREARDRFPSDDVAFGVWLVQEQVNVGPNDRAALITMGAEPETLRGVLVDQTDALHADTIYRKCKGLFGKAPIDELPVEGPPKAPQEPAKSQTAIPEDGKTKITVATPRAASMTARPRKAFANTGPKSPIAKLPNADLVNAHIRSSHTRILLAKLYRSSRTRWIWGALIEAIESGLFGEPADYSAFTPTLRILLPWLPERGLKRYHLDQPHMEVMVRDVIFPLLRSRPELRQATYKVEDAIEQAQRDYDDRNRRQAILARSQARVAKLPKTEQAIVAYGEPLWPLPHPDLTPPYTYMELCHACWYADFLMGMVTQAKMSPLSLAISARHLTKYIAPLQPGFVAAVRAIFNAYEGNPKGAFVRPSPPVNFQY